VKSFQLGAANPVADRFTRTDCAVDAIVNGLIDMIQASGK
jgi:hypothetical protein